MKNKFFFYSIVFLFTLLCYIGNSKRRKTKQKSFQFNSICGGKVQALIPKRQLQLLLLAPIPPPAILPLEYLSHSRSRTHKCTPIVSVCVNLERNVNKQSAKDTKNNNHQGTDLKRTNKKKKNQVCTFPPPSPLRLYN